MNNQSRPTIFLSMISICFSLNSKDFAFKCSSSRVTHPSVCLHNHIIVFPLSFPHPSPVLPSTVQPIPNCPSSSKFAAPVSLCNPANEYDSLCIPTRNYYILFLFIHLFITRYFFFFHSYFSSASPCLNHKSLHLININLISKQVRKNVLTDRS